ncbi:MMPL family transporter [Microbacterium aurugineum]
MVGGLALLGVLAGGLAGASVGLTQVEKFRVASESAAGLTTLGDHFPAGEAQPMVVIGETADAEALAAAIDDVPGVLRVSVTGDSRDGVLTRLLVVGEPAPGTTESLDLVSAVREAAASVPEADAVVGGPVAADLDARAGNQRDVLLIVPLVLAVSLLVLIVLLRSLVAPVLLLVVNILSAVAAIGAGTWLSRVVFGWESLDLQVPLLSFLFLVALGIDYTIFLVHRARIEAQTVGTRQGMVRAVTATGGVITSAGVVLAAVFAALGLLPLVTLGQIGLIVGIGVLVDTFVVRTLVVPALFALVGERMWWPRKVGGAGSRADRHGDHPRGGEYEDAAVAVPADAG